LGNVPVTGYYGSVTETAVRNFQVRNGLRADGVAGAETLSYLGLGNIGGSSVDNNRYPNDRFNDGFYDRVTLRRGSRGERVAELQRALGNVSVSGYYDPSTERAVRNFQASVGLPVNGVAGAETLSYLGLGNIGGSSVDNNRYPNDRFNDGFYDRVTLRRGSRSQRVAELQRALGNVSVSGYYDPSTERAVRNFQASIGLRADGVAGAETLSALGLGNPSTQPYNTDYLRNSGYSGYSGISVGGP
jgi:peptidoglycan hydrolase-like protein with peptidoglycan-binding domain